jgi:hypothetical protein
MQKYTAKPNKYTTNIDRYVKGNWEQKGNIILQGYTANIDKTQRTLAYYQDTNGIWHTGFAKVTTTKEIVGLTVMAIIILIVLVILIVTIGDAITAAEIAQEVQAVQAAAQRIVTPGTAVYIGGTSSRGGVPIVSNKLYAAHIMQKNVYTRLTGGTFNPETHVPLMTQIRFVANTQNGWNAVTGTTIMLYDIQTFLTVMWDPEILAWNMANGFFCVPLLVM